MDHRAAGSVVIGRSNYFGIGFSTVIKKKTQVPRQSILGRQISKVVFAGACCLCNMLAITEQRRRERKELTEFNNPFIDDEILR